MNYRSMALRFEVARENAYSERDDKRRRAEYEQGMTFLEEFDQLCRDHGYTIKGGEIVGYGEPLHDDVMDKLTKHIEERSA